MAYAEIEPFGEPRADLRSGIIASTIAEVNRDRKARSKPYEPADFIISFPVEVREEQTWETILSKVEMLNKAFGGRDLRDR